MIVCGLDEAISRSRKLPLRCLFLIVNAAEYAVCCVGVPMYVHEAGWGCVLHWETDSLVCSKGRQSYFLTQR